MTKYLIYIITLFIVPYTINAQFFNNSTNANSDSTHYPIIKIKPNKLYIVNDTSRFVTREVKVLNYGNAPLRIIRANGSCYCSSVKIMNSVIYPMEVGTLILDINKDGLMEANDTVLFTITSNSKSSPTFIKVIFVEKKNKIPAKKKQ